jgi:hypothetical protein
LRKRLANEEADDLRVEHIAAQLEEAEQQRVTDDWLEEQEQLDATLPRTILIPARDTAMTATEIQ